MTAARAMPHLHSFSEKEDHHVSNHENEATVN